MPYYIAADSEAQAWGELRNRRSRDVFTEPAPAAQRAAECRLQGWPTEVFVTGPLQRLGRDPDVDARHCLSCEREIRGHGWNREFCGRCEGKEE